MDTGSRGERPRNCSWKDQSMSRGGEESRTKERPPLPRLPSHLSGQRGAHIHSQNSLPQRGRTPTGIHASTQAGWGVGARQSPGSSTGRKASRHVCSESTRVGARGATWCARGIVGATRPGTAWRCPVWMPTHSLTQPCLTSKTHPSGT